MLTIILHFLLILLAEYYCYLHQIQYQYIGLIHMLTIILLFLLVLLSLSSPSPERLLYDNDH